MSRVSNQSGRVLDAISAGPIEGLVNGKQSIFYNDTPIATPGITTAEIDSTTINLSANVVQGSNIVKVPSSSVSDIDTSTLSQYPRWMWVEGVGRSTELAMYGGIGVLSKPRGHFTTILDGNSKGKGLVVFPWKPDGRAAWAASAEDQPDLGSDERKLFLRETLDLEYYARTGNFAAQGENSAVKQTFTASIRHKPYGSSVSYDRKHYIRTLSSFGKNDEQPAKDQYKNTHVYEDCLASLYSVSTDNPSDYGRAATFGNTGSGSSGHPEGDYKQSYIRFDLVAKILDITPSSTPGFHEIELECSNSASSWLPRLPALTKNSVRSHIFTPASTSVSQAKFRGSAAFKNGERGQEAMGVSEGNVTSPRTNVVINPNSQLLWGNKYSGGSAAPTIFTATGTSSASLGLSSLQAAQVDAVRFNIVFPQGLFRIDKNGSYSKAPFDAYVKFRYRNSRSDNFKEVVVRGKEQDPDWWGVPGNLGYSGKFSDAGPGMLIEENRKGTFSREIEIDVTQFQPFIDFEIEIDRTTPDNHSDYTSVTSRANPDFYKQASLTANIQYVQALFFDKFKYPLTAYSAVTFSGADFDSIPARSYHCRGLKIQVPSNYITREEDALLSGDGKGEARYSRLTAINSSIEDKTISTSERLILRDKISTIIDSTQSVSSTGVGYKLGDAKPGTIDPELGNLITEVRQIGTQVIIGFDTTYKLYGDSTTKLGSFVKSISITDLETGLSLLDSFNTDFTDTYARTTATVDVGGVTIIESGKRYKVEVIFSSKVVRPNDYVVWDGKFRDELVYTNNPAWIFYDILVNKEYGLGDYVKKEDVDIFELYAIGRYCDELVPDGKGGLEPRFTCNTYISKITEAYKVLKDLSSAFRGMTVWQDSKISPIQDRPSEPVYLFTQANVIDGKFSYERIGVKAATNSIELTWNDPEQQYRQDVLVLDDLSAQLASGRVSSKKIVAYGCTSKGQAKRAAEWHMLTNTREGKIVSFSSSINSAGLKIGDVITIQDQQRGQKVVSSGRVKSYDQANTVILDREIAMDPAKSYLFCVQISDPVYYLQQNTATINGITYSRGQVIEQDIFGQTLIAGRLNEQSIVDDNSNSVVVQKSTRSSIIKKEVIQPNTADYVYLSSPIEYFRDGADMGLNEQGHEERDTDQIKEHIFAIVENTDTENAPTENYRITGITQSSDKMNIDFNAVLQDPSKYSEIDYKNGTISDPFFDDELASSVLSVPVNASAAMAPDLITEEGGGSSLGGYDLIVEWNVPTQQITDSNGNTFDIQARDIAGYSVEHDVYQKLTPGGTDTITLTGIENTEIKLLNVDEGTYTFKIRAFGHGNPIRYSEPLVFIKKVSPPVGVGKIGRIPKGGDINSALDFNTTTGLLKILKSNYLFKNVSNFEYEVTSATTAQKEQSFSALSNGNSAFWLYNHGEVDPWKAAQIHVDAATKDGQTENTTSFSYLKELGASNNGLSTLSSGRTFSISNIEVTQPRSKIIVTTSAANYLSDGDSITFSSVGGMVELNGQTVTARVHHSSIPNQIVLYNSDNTGILLGHDYTDYTSGGTITTSSAIRGSGVASSPTIKGTNTSFTTDFQSGDLIKITTSSSIGTEVATSEYCEIELVVDDHTLNLVNPLSRTYTDAYLFAQTLKVDIVNDTILAEVSKADDLFSIKYDATFKSLDTSEGDSVNELDTVRTLPTHVVDDSATQGELAQLTIPNNSGATSTASANAIIKGSLGHRGTPVNLDSITSSSIAVFETTSAHGLTDLQMVEIAGIATQYPMSALNGTTGKVVLGSGGLVTGSDPVGNSRMTILTPGSAYPGTNHASATVNIEPLIPSGGVIMGTATASVSNGTLSIASIDTTGVGYTKSTGGSFVRIVMGSNSYSITLAAAGVVSDDYTTKFRLVEPTFVETFSWSGQKAHVTDISDYVDSSSYTALTADTGTVTHINPATFELTVEGTFPENTKTLPNAYITATGRIVADPGLSLQNQYIDVEGGSLTANQLKANYNLNPGATFKQVNSGSQVFCGTIYSVISLTATKIRVIFLDVQGYLFFALSGPAINIGTSAQATYNGLFPTVFGSSSEILAAAEVQLDSTASDIVFSNVTPSSTSGSGDITGGDSLQCSFTVKTSGKVVSATVNSSRQGTGFKDLDTITFTDGDLNGVNSNYGSSRGDITFYVDINGAINTSVDGTSTYGGTGEIIVDSVSNVIGSETVELDGRVTTKTTSSYTAKVKGYLSTASGFEIASTSNLGTSSNATFAGNSSVTSFLSTGNDVKIEGITGLAPTSIYKVFHASAPATLSIKDSDGTFVPGTGLSHTDAGDPGDTGFVRGTNGFVIGPGATEVDSVVLGGSLIV